MKETVPEQVTQRGLPDILAMNSLWTLDSEINAVIKSRDGPDRAAL